MKKIIYYSLLFFCPFFPMQQDSQKPPATKERMHDWKTADAAQLPQLQPATSIQPKSLPEIAQDCIHALDTVIDDKKSNEKFAKALDLFSEQALNTPKFCILWKTAYQFQWLSKAEAKVRVAQLLLAKEAETNSINTVQGAVKEATLAHAIENQMRLQKFDELCKHFLPAQG